MPTLTDVLTHLGALQASVDQLQKQGDALMAAIQEILDFQAVAVPAIAQAAAIMAALRTALATPQPLNAESVAILDDLKAKFTALTKVPVPAPAPPTP